MIKEKHHVLSDFTILKTLSTSDMNALNEG